MTKTQRMHKQKRTIKATFHPLNLADRNRFGRCMLRRWGWGTPHEEHARSRIKENFRYHRLVNAGNYPNNGLEFLLALQLESYKLTLKF